MVTGRVEVGAILDPSPGKKDLTNEVESSNDEEIRVSDAPESMNDSDRGHSGSSNDSLSDNNAKGKNKNKRPAKGRVFQCTGYPDCNMSFTRSEHLARHKRKHTGERPFTCPHCTKNFSRLDNLRQHQQTVHAYEKLISGGTLKEHEALKGSIQPKTPSSMYFDLNNETFEDEGALISPPNSSSPAYPYSYHNMHQYPRGQPNINGSYSPPAFSLPHVHQLATPPPSSQINFLKNPNVFKPKRRPKPLSLQHSFINDTGNRLSADGDNNGLHNSFQYQETLKTAPPAPSSRVQSSSFPSFSVSNGPRSALLKPQTASPFSPLFHQSFSQVNNANKTNRVQKEVTRPSFFPSIKYSQSNQTTLPSVSELTFSQKKSPNLMLSHLLNDEESEACTTTLRTEDAVDKGPVIKTMQ
ncbi:uncharacterized protein PRCAT00002185001 [Priceomyces carsonii]|uniref:uncharacterized protein n=1 Tax=Priceomyces carsonii TaxID=28549 RepID=UPI002ED7C5C3|nr:unnamed protein product [Priceomyces carsonii]